MLFRSAIAVEDRIELARLEWADQKRRMAQLVVLLVLFGCVAVIALLLLSLAVLVQFWDSPQRVLVAWLLAGGWLLAWVAVAVALVSIGRQAGNAFALTRRELQQDWRTIKEQL